MKAELERAIHAYREVHCADALNTQALEQRIVTSVGSRRRGAAHRQASGRRFSSLAVAATMSICATAAYALTDHGHQRLRFLVDWLAPASRQDAVAVPNAVAHPNNIAVTTVSQPVPPPGSVSSVELADLPGTLSNGPAGAHERDPAAMPEPGVGAPPSDASVFARPSVEHLPKAGASLKREVKADDDAHRRLYRRAQRLAAEGRYQEALALWDEYLAQYANEPLHVEARFNRIRNLIVLERYAEASAALLPFANGEFGRYRQEQARSLRRMLMR